VGPYPIHPRESSAAGSLVTPGPPRSVLERFDGALMRTAGSVHPAHGKAGYAGSDVNEIQVFYVAPDLTTFQTLSGLHA